MKKILNITGQIILTLIFFDILILFVALAQVAIGQGGYWNSFWTAQAKVVISLLN